MSNNKPNKVKILSCNIFSPEGDPVRDKIGQFVDVVPCPDEYKHKFNDDIWVMGKTEPIRLLRQEYQII